MIVRYLPRAAFILIFALGIYAAGILATRMDAHHFPELLACWSGVGYLAAGWLLTRFGIVRRSPGIFASGLAGSAIGGALVGSLSVSRVIDPALAMGCEVIGLAIGAAMPQQAFKAGWPAIFLFVVLVAWGSGVAVAHVNIDAKWIIYLFLAIGIAAAVGLHLRRSQRQSPASVTLIVLNAALIAGSFLLAIFPAIPVRAELAYYTLLAGIPFVAAAAALADVLDVEKLLRFGVPSSSDSSMIDALTKVSSRRALDTFGPQLCNQSYKTERPVSILVLDIDNFKQINDTYGHAVGDAALKQLSSVVSSKVRASDLVGRFGGDEFVVVLPGSPLAPAMRLAEGIRVAVNESAFTVDGTAIKLSTSIGVVTSFPEDATDFIQLLSRADGNLYRAKRAGRNRVAADAVPYE
jgi:diguanylate cyclase (GGDEF)-like protein